jgi:DNA-binding response OmpR family regulator
MNVTSTQLAVPPMQSLDLMGRCAPTSESPPPAVLLIYGEERANAALADELTLDGYEVRRASNPARLRAACDACQIELVIFGRATRRGAGLDVLRALRAGAFSPEVAPRSRTLWMSPNGDLGDVLRAFEGGADDVLRAPSRTRSFARVCVRSCAARLRAHPA